MSDRAFEQSEIRVLPARPDDGLMAPAPAPAADPVATMALASGKGGVGKSVLAVNLAAALVTCGRRVLVVDADNGPASVPDLIGLQPPPASVAGEDGLHIATVAGSREEFAHLDELARERLLLGFKAMASSCADLVVFDVPTGIGCGPLKQVASAVDHLILVVIPERTALAEAYAVLKQIARRRRSPEVSILFNRGHSTAELGVAAQRLIETATQYLRIRPRLLGWVPFDEAVARSIAARVPFVRGEPEARASRAVSAIAHRLAGMPPFDPPRLDLILPPLAGGAEPGAMAAEIRKAS